MNPQTAIYQDVTTGKQYIAIEVIDGGDFKPVVRQIVTLSTSLDVGDQKSGEAGLFEPQQFQQRFTRVK